MPIETYNNVRTSDEEYMAEVEIETAAEITSMSITEHSKLTQLDYESSGHTGFAGIKYGTTEYWESHGSFVPLQNFIIIYTDYQQDKDNNPIFGIKIGDGATSVGNLTFVLDKVNEDIEEENELIQEVQNEIQTIKDAGYLTQEINSTQIEIQYTKSLSKNYVSKETQWNYVSVPSAARFLGTAFGRDNYVCVGMGGAVIYSEDGINWTSLEHAFTSANITKVCYGNGYFLALCPHTHMIYKSYSLEHWDSLARLEIFPRNIQYINNLFFLVGENGYLAVSPTGEDWKEIELPVNKNVNAVAYGKGKYVAVGDDGLMLYSFNGKNWVDESEPEFSEDIKYVSFGNGMFILGGESKIKYSTNGYAWSNAIIPDMTDMKVEEIVWGEGRCYIALINQQTNQGTIWESYTGRIFAQSYTSSDGRGIYSICYGNDRFIATSEEQQAFLLDLGVEWSLTKPSLEETEFLWGRTVNYLNNGDILYSNSYYIFTPKGVSEFTNDAGYITNTVNNLVNYYTKVETDDLLAEKVDKDAEIKNEEIDLLFN